MPGTVSLPLPDLVRILEAEIPLGLRISRSGTRTYLIGFHRPKDADVQVWGEFRATLSLQPDDVTRPLFLVKTSGIPELPAGYQHRMTRPESDELLASLHVKPFSQADENLVTMTTLQGSDDAEKWRLRFWHHLRELGDAHGLREQDLEEARALVGNVINRMQFNGELRKQDPLHLWQMVREYLGLPQGTQDTEQENL